MPDLSLQVTVSRDNLGLAPLNINDHLNYFIAGDFLTGQLSWNRNQVSSPFIDGQITTFRTLQNVTRAITVEVLDDDLGIGQLQSNMQTLVAAFGQDNFQISIYMDTTLNLEYRCEAADYQVNWTGPRVVARQLQVAFQVPCQPVPVVGGY